MGACSGASVHERLRLVQLPLRSGGAGAPPGSHDYGPIVGTLSGTLLFNPFGSPPASPIPFQTQDGVFRFFDRQKGRRSALCAPTLSKVEPFQPCCSGHQCRCSGLAASGHLFRVLDRSTGLAG